MEREQPSWYNSDPALLWEDAPQLGWSRFFPAWHKYASCSGKDERMFFGHGEFESRPALTPTELRKAQDVCFFCPVFNECLTYALEAREKYGIWAGTSRRTRTKAWNMIDAGKITISEIVIQFGEARDELVRRRYGKGNSPQG